MTIRAAVVIHAVNGDADFVKKAILSGGTQVDCLDADGTTPLSAACFAAAISETQPAWPAFIQWLLDRGADVNKPAANVRTRRHHMPDAFPLHH